MEAIEVVLTVAAILALWVAAVVWGHDSRDGRDWFPQDQPPRAPAADRRLTRPDGARP
jgi:hypothetical protein